MKFMDEKLQYKWWWRSCLFILLCLGALANTQAQFTNLKFENLSTESGLSSSTCVAILQDQQGYMWFGTINGLNRFDGYSFEVFQSIPRDPNTISSNRISALAEDAEGRLWIGTGNGLNVYEYEQERFIRIRLRHDSTQDYLVDNITALYYDEVENSIWVGTENGLNRLSLDGVVISSGKALSFDHYSHKPTNPASLDNNHVRNILRDADNRIWIGTEGSYLNQYRSAEDDFVRKLVDPHQPYALDHIPKKILVDKTGNFWIGNDLSRLVYWDRQRDTVQLISPVSTTIPLFDIYEDEAGYIWLATDGYGIYILDSTKRLIQHIEHIPADPFSLPNNQPSQIMEDEDGIYWIASYNTGISKLVLSKSSFVHHYYQPGNELGLSGKIAQAVMQDSKGRIWIGTDGAGLNQFVESTHRFLHYQNKSTRANTLSSNKIVYLFEGQSGAIWVCTWDGGLNRFDPETAQTKRYLHVETDPYSIGQNTVWYAVEDKQQRLWLGTQTDGLNLFDPITERFYSFQGTGDAYSNLPSNFVFSLYIDSQNRLLVGTSLGLCVLELDKLDAYIPKSLTFRRIAEDVIQHRVNYMHEDKQGHIWLATDIGLHEFDAELVQQRSFTTTEGLPNNLTLGIAEDAQGFLWLTTKSGLSRIDPSSGAVKNFNIHDGIQGMEFQSKAIDKLQDGRIIIGGINGFNIFDPANINSTSDTVKPLIQSLKLFNEVIRPGGDGASKSLLSRSISATEELRLDYDQNSLTFELAGLYYQNPERVQYAYRMEGLESDFYFAGNNRIANYPSLPPGKYTFVVKTYLDGQWEDAQAHRLQLYIAPPPWKSWWAYTIYGIVLAVLLGLGLRYYTRMVREEKEHELDQMKLRFFINVSHEFRTPLTLILNPVEKLLAADHPPEEVRSSALVIQRSAQRLLNLVNQLLDFRRMDMGKMPLEPYRGDLLKFCQDILFLFEESARQKQLVLTFEADSESCIAHFDPDKVEKIVTNLLTNAIKFTEPGGKIILLFKAVQGNALKRTTLRRQAKNEMVEIYVKDTGIGFRRDQLKDVFSRFFHEDNSKTGTGIGLNFTKGLVELMGGTISVDSTYGQGSTFGVRLPRWLEVPKVRVRELKNWLDNQGAFEEDTLKSIAYEVAIADNGNKDHSAAPPVAQEVGGERKRILIVEDNRELRQLLESELQKHYQVLQAADGEEGLRMVHKYYPDLIISDVMMPKRDGFELCRLLKSDLDTCHIPLILLTARSQEGDRIAGFDTGADEYLAKPFSTKVLLARIRNLLDARRRLRDKFTALGNGALNTTALTSNSLDEAFLDKAAMVVVENLGNQDFDLEVLLNELGVSRSQFYRKIKSLTNQNPSQFIRTIRLKQAAQLLKQNRYSIKEVAYMVGFNSPAYFSKTFREYFELTPNAYASQATEKE